MSRSIRFSPAAAFAELVPSNNEQPLDLHEVFGRSAPVEVDLGCGDGEFLSSMAALHPERDFLGVELLLGRVRSACKKIARQELRNARILRVEISAAVGHLLAPESVSTFHLNFPDPWPKRRHHHRRVVTADWLRSIARVLVTGGALRMVTDQPDYFAHMQGLIAASPDFVLTDEVAVAEYPVSTFEAHFRATGALIHRLGARKVSPVR